MKLFPKFSLALSFTIISALLTTTAFASFTDVPTNHQNYDAIMYLQSHNYIQGYSDGTFRPDQPVVRAEAVKIIFETLFTEFDGVTENPFPDVPKEEWYAKYVLKGKTMGVVSGDGATGNFVGTRNVNLVEYLKMLLLSYNIDLSLYENPSDILFNDVQDLGQWFIPFLYYSAATNLVNADMSNNIYPGNALTRAEVAEITYRLLVNVEGGELQLYLSMTEAEIIKVLQYLNVNDVTNAQTSATKAVSYADKAYSLDSAEPLVQAAQKIAYAFDHLVKGYQSGIDEDYAAAESHAGEAWALADQAQALDTSVMNLGENVKDIAHDMAESARTSLESIQ